MTIVSFDTAADDQRNRLLHGEPEGVALPVHQVLIVRHLQPAQGQGKRVVTAHFIFAAFHIPIGLSIIKMATVKQGARLLERELEQAAIVPPLVLVSFRSMGQAAPHNKPVVCITHKEPFIIITHLSSS